MSKKKTQLKNYGFVEPEIKASDYVFGASKLPTEIVRPDGQWEDFIAPKEVQLKNGLEVMNCTNYGTLDCLDTLENALYNTQVDKAERYTGVCTGTTTSGNSPSNVIETIRKICGLIPDKALPWTTESTWNAYYSPKPMTEELLNMGKEWLKHFEVGYEWVSTNYNPNQRAMMEALKYSPLGVSVQAWRCNSNGLYYKNKYAQDNHWCSCIGYKEGEYWIIRDSYDQDIKHLTWHYNFGFVMRYYLKKKPMLKTIQKKGEKEVYVIWRNKRFWITPAKLFNFFADSGLIGDWDKIEPVDKFDLPLGGVWGEMSLGDAERYAALKAEETN